ncbi:MAG: hypothetical protein ACYDEA_01585 [Candidatus Dormibacteria bacterium]
MGVIEVLNRHGVAYVIIGGFAAAAQGSSLSTGDIDVTPERSPENLARLSEALTELDARVRVAETPEGVHFSHSGDSLLGIALLNLTTRHGDLDLVMEPAGGTTYWELASRALTIQVHGVEMTLAGLNDIIDSKAAANRPKDREAIRVLQELRDQLARNSVDDPD